MIRIFVIIWTYLLWASSVRSQPPGKHGGVVGGERLIRRNKGEGRRESLNHLKAGVNQNSSSSSSLKEKHIPWKSIDMPTKSYFGGMPPPNDTELWSLAIMHARRGSQILLSALREKIKSPFHLIHGDIHFRWLHRQADVFLSNANLKPEQSRDFKALNTEYFGQRTPVAMMGYYEFAHKLEEGGGAAVRHMDFGLEWLAAQQNMSSPQLIPRPFVGIGCPNENWGWLSTYFLNRTINWKHSFSGKDIFRSQADHTRELQQFLNDERLIMLVVNQHHNISHPKLISVPIGLVNTRAAWFAINNVLKKKTPKRELFNSVTSAWGARPAIKKCVFANLGIDERAGRFMGRDEFYEDLASSMTVLCLPGLGYDSYRLSESLAMGTMPIIERGIGFDRTVHRLPVLVVDDFADLTLLMIQQAYVEALYRALRGDWQYERLSPSWWEGLIHESAIAGDLSVLEERHPYGAIDSNFTRPLVPFDCDKMGGCGPGTKRVPKRSCAIDFDMDFDAYGKRGMWTWAK